MYVTDGIHDTYVDPGAHCIGAGTKFIHQKNNGLKIIFMVTDGKDITDGSLEISYPDLVVSSFHGAFHAT